MAVALPGVGFAAGSPDVVISQVYGGGGNAGATYKNDFIELHNRGASAVSLNGWSVQYYSATGTGTWSGVTNLPNVTLQPGQYFLIQEAAGTGGTVNLPPPDATGNINMSATAGKVALVTTTTVLSGACPSANVKDLVGFGGSNCYESSPSAVLTNTTAAIRNSNSCTDSDNNSSDFTTSGGPTPRNTATIVQTCAVPVNGSCGTDNGQALAATAPTNYCSSGTLSSFSGSGHPWTWRCLGQNGGSDVTTCSATIQSYNLTFTTDGNGTLSGTTPQSVDFGASSSAVAANGNAGYSFLNWNGTTYANPLTVTNVTASQTITANFTATPVNGVCGIDDEKTLAATAPTNLCASGAATAVTGDGHPWSWTCAGTNGGNTPSCSATIQTYTLTFATDGNGTLDGTASQTVDFGGSATPVTASAKDNYYFFNWTGTNGLTTTTSNPLAVSNITASRNYTANFKGGFTIFHVNDTHARVTPHKWMVTEHSSNTAPVFEDVGGAAFLASEMLQLTAAQPNSLVIDAGDISEGNPIGDMGGNGSMTQFYTLLSGKLKNVPGRSSRGMDAVVVGNHDVRDINYINNLVALKNSGVPVISVNVRDAVTHQPYFAPSNIVTINGTRIGILGYTTQASEVGASLASTLVVDPCDWDGTSTTPDACHLASYVNDLRNNQGCDVVVLAAHIGHSSIVDPTAPLLVDNASAKLPEVVVSGHWHTWADTVWQPEMLGYKTIFTEAASYMKYIGELKVTDTGAYVSAVQHVIRDADITPDPDVQNLVDNLTTQYNAAHPGHPVNEVIGYTADNLMLDNNMKWWSSNEFPWSGNNTAGQWICDAMRWKAEQLFGQCDLSIESGGGVRADIPAGPVTFLKIYETFPWNDDFFTRVNMTGQEIFNFLKLTNMGAGFSSALDVSAFDGVATSIKFNGQPIDLNHNYTVAINNYMYAHPPTGWTWSDKAPLASTVLCRDGIVDFMRQFTEGNPYQVGGPRYHLNTEFSGGYRAVVTMMNDDDTKPTFEDAFVRFLSASPETLARRGGNQVPADLVNADGSINPNNRLAEAELFRSYLGFKKGALKPGDIVETWGKGSFYGGDPEFVDQEGIYADGVEFKIVGHDDGLAKPAFQPTIGAFWNDFYKNHYVQFLAKKSGTSSVTDQNGQTLAIMDATGYVAKTLAGSVGDTLLVSGVPTMENYGLRFRCDNAVTSTTPMPAASSVSSRLAPVAPGTTGSQLTLSATAAVNAGTYYLAPVADAQIASGKPTTNYNTTNLYLQSSSVNTYGNERAWLKFDLSYLPSGTSISSASLQLWDWKATGASMPAEVRGGSDDSWTETGITWATQPVLSGTALDTQTLAAGTANLWYNWDVTSFAQGKMNGNKLVSLAVKAATEGSPDATAPSYGFDSKEYGSNAPVLKVTAQASGNSIAQVKFYYRYASDNATWGPWTLTNTATSAPYTTGFSFPEGSGYYEFYSQATDSGSNVEPVSGLSQTATHYTSSPAYYPIVSLDGLYQKYNGSAKPVTITTIPGGASYSVTYNGSSSAPTAPGTYAVSVTASEGGNTVSTNGILNIAKAAAAVSLADLNYIYDGTPKSATVSTTPSTLNNVTVTYNGSTTVPTAAGKYRVAAVINDPDYQGGATGTLTIAGDISSQMKVITNGTVYNRATKIYNGSVTVTNIGQSDITGTVYVQLNNLTAGVTVVNAAGTYNGAPYVSKAPATPLKPGQSLSIPIMLTNPANTRINFNAVSLN
jgi:2',3'-cyclic-nucleotide 2'-phosphodiesterase (5'-nucleotidase family)